MYTIDPLTAYLIRRLRTADTKDAVHVEEALYELGYDVYERPKEYSLEKMALVSPLPNGELVEEFERWKEPVEGFPNSGFTAICSVFQLSRR